MKRTELVFILDMSGSMEHLTDDTIGGFNSILKEQADKGGEVLVTTYVFNNDARMLHDRLPIEQVSPMTRRDYRASGCTALLDAIGDAIHHIGNVHKYARPEDVPEKTLFVITTDGYENASHKYGADEIRAKIKRQQDKYGWEFLFLGANIDAIETARNFGIDEDRAANFVNDKSGIGVMYEAQCCLMSDIRHNRKNSRQWKAKVDADYAKRGGHNGK